LQSTPVVGGALLEAELGHLAEERGDVVVEEEEHLVRVRVRVR